MPIPGRDRNHDPDPCWTHDRLLGELPLPDGPSLVRLRPHYSEEAYHGRNIAELVPLTCPAGARGYAHARPDVLEPEVTLTVGLFPIPRGGGAVGEVVDAAWEGMRHAEIGQVQALPRRPVARALAVLPVRPLARRRPEPQPGAGRPLARRRGLAPGPLPRHRAPRVAVVGSHLRAAGVAGPS
jgi:hypothetical protein